MRKGSNDARRFRDDALLFFGAGFPITGIEYFKRAAFVKA
jgi:hypothetical protein